MRTIFFFFFLFTGIALNAQISIKATVLDSATKNPVPYSLVVTSSHKFGVITNDKGEFELSLPDSLRNNYLKVTSIGYDTSLVNIGAFLKSDNKNIFITQKFSVLSEVSITSIDHDKLCKEKWGVTKKSCNGDWMGRDGWEVAVFMSNSIGDSGIISSLKFYITGEGNPETPFRAKLYYINQKDSCPGELMIDQDLIITPKRGNKWAEIDISNFNISIPKEGFFVAMEWLPVCKCYNYINPIGGTSYGQVLGMNDELKYRGSWQKDNLGKWNSGKWKHIIAPLFPDANAMIGADVLIECK